MNDFLILPNQLFDKKYLNKKKNYYLYEHPHYFKSYNYNKKKIILHRASMKYYFNYLKDNNFKVKYYNFKSKPLISKYQLFDPIDKIKLYGKYEIIDSPNFLLTLDNYNQYKKKSDKFFFNSFYMWGKKIVDIIPNIKSTDRENRNKLDKNVKIPKVPSNKSDKQYIDEAIKYVNKNFSKNYGNTENFIFPITHNTAKKWLGNFIKNKFKNFGKYQDSIDKDNNTLFHSLLSTSINIGLLNPGEIIQIIKKIKSKIPINSFEGYIRQLFWREYQRYCYININFNNKNYFGNKNKLTKKWYTGELGIQPVDDSIKNAFETGYLHHIERLMIVGNYMMISSISPKEGYKWFMEFSCDSYEWVMHQNVYDMVFCVTGGMTMRKPYISKSTYLLKMSNYKKDEWSKKWDDMYETFCKRNKKKLLDKFKYHFHFIKNY